MTATAACSGRKPGWPTGMHSTLAGFVEPGESLEEAVAREVFEETERPRRRGRVITRRSPGRSRPRSCSASTRRARSTDHRARSRRDRARGAGTSEAISSRTRTMTSCACRGAIRSRAASSRTGSGGRRGSRRSRGWSRKAKRSRWRATTLSSCASSSASLRLGAEDEEIGRGFEPAGAGRKRDAAGRGVHAHREAVLEMLAQLRHVALRQGGGDARLGLHGPAISCAPP